MLVKMALICAAHGVRDNPRNVRAVSVSGTELRFEGVNARWQVRDRLARALGVDYTRVHLRTAEGQPLPDDADEWVAGDGDVVDVFYPCPRCLPIELENGPDRQAALRELAQTGITMQGVSYVYVGTGPNRLGHGFDVENDDLVWRGIGDNSFIVCRTSLIGTENPFILFKEGEGSQRWFANLTPAQQTRALNSLRNNPCSFYSRHIELVRCPDGGETTPFTVVEDRVDPDNWRQVFPESRPRQVVGRCPDCHNEPNPHIFNGDGLNARDAAIAQRRAESEAAKRRELERMDEELEKVKREQARYWRVVWLVVGLLGAAAVVTLVTYCLVRRCRNNQETAPAEAEGGVEADMGPVGIEV